MMRSALILAGCAASALLWSGPALALSLETACENAKLRAAGTYARCLARAARDANATSDDLSAEAIEHCDERFDRMFERAEATGACRTAGGPATLRGPIRGQMTETLESTTAGPGCPTTPVRDGETYVCTLTKGSAVDLAQIVTQIDQPDVTIESIVWIEAWGGTGSHGNTSNGGGGARGGYAQTTTTIVDLGTTTLHYYLGKAGTTAANSGGDGGTATLVTFNDLTKEAPTLDDTLLIAGGGGGGGGGRGTASACGTSSSDLDVLGGAGGGGGVAIADTSGPVSGAGGTGGARRGTNHSGHGGNDGNGGANGGSNAQPGANGIAALGGAAGNHNTPTVGFTNQTGVRVTASGGRGGQPGDDAGGGGGGGGASFAEAATVSCSRSRPGDSPSGSTGAVQIVFQAGACG